MGHKVLGEEKEAVEANFCLICRHISIHWALIGGTEAGTTARLQDIPAIRGGTAIATGRLYLGHLGHWWSGDQRKGINSEEMKRSQLSLMMQGGVGKKHSIRSREDGVS